LELVSCDLGSKKVRIFRKQSEEQQIGNQQFSKKAIEVGDSSTFAHVVQELLLMFHE
jgi:hypothetical protein